MFLLSGFFHIAKMLIQLLADYQKVNRMFFYKFTSSNQHYFMKKYDCIRNGIYNKKNQ